MNRFYAIKKLAIFILWIILSYPGMASSIEYIQTDIPGLGGSHVWAWDLNESGQVVGFSSIPPDDDIHAFLAEWDGTSWTMSDLGTLSGGQSSQALAINESAQIVGYSRLPDTTEHAFLYEDGTMQDLGTLGGDSSHAIAINDAGQIVGRSRLSTGEIRAFLYNNGTMMDIGTLSGGTESWAYAISNRGEIIGFSNTAAAPDSYRAFMWRTNPEHHAGTIWQISTVEDDFSDANLVLNKASNTGLTEFVVPGNILAPNTTYYWRAAFVDEYGAISEWPADTFSFTTPDVLANNPPNQPVNLSPDVSSDSLTPTLSIGSYSDPDGDSHAYTEWQMSTVSGDFSAPILNALSETAVNTYPIPTGLLSYDMTYYWRVRFHDERGATSSWANASFSTPSVTSNLPPLAPVLATPANGSTNVIFNPMLDLDTETQPFSDPDGDSHGQTQWQIGDNQDFTGDIVLDLNSSTSLYYLTVPPAVLAENTTYWWRARFYDHKGGASDWSTPYGFTTLTIPAGNTPNTPPDAPTLSTVTATNTTPTLTTGAYVDAESNNHTGTYWQVSTDAAFATLLIDDLSMTKKESYPVPSGVLAYNTTYYWRARFYDQYNGESAWSTTGSFATPTAPANSPPDPPTLSAPSDDSLTPTLTASGYNDPDGDSHGQTQWQISTVSDFATVVLDKTSSTNLLSYEVPAGTLLPATTYYWRAIFYDSNNEPSSAPTPVSFTTLTAPANVPPNAPYLLSPTDGATVSSLTPTLQTQMFFDSDGNMTDLGTLGGALSTGLLINDYTEIAGDSEYDTSSNTHAFLWIESALTDLGTLGGSNSLAVDINNRTQIVGSSDDATNTNSAFLWENGTMTDLQDPSLLPIASTWDFEAATGINTGREIIVVGTFNENKVSALLYPDPTTIPTNTAPNAPVILYPTASDTDVPVTLTLQTDPASYVDPDNGHHLKTQFQISSTSDYSVVILDIDVTDLNNLYDLVVPDGILTTGQTYYWRVRFYDIDNDYSPWASSSFSTINSPPSAPTLSAPTGEDAVDIDAAADLTLATGPFFDPEGNSHSLTQWQVTTASDTTFLTPLINDTSPTALTSFTIVYNAAAPTLNTGTSYIWRARFYDSLNGVSDWSDAFSFSTEGVAPDAPELVSPDNNAVEIPIDSLLQTGAFVDPDGQAHASTHWQVSTNAQFTDFVMDDNSTTDLTSHSLAGYVTTGRTYYWHIRFYDSSGDRTSWSETRVFTTVNNPPDTPTLQTPDSSDPAPTLTASTFSDPDLNTHSQTTWQISTSADFSAVGALIVDATSTTALTSYTIPSHVLSSGTTYYLRVQYFDSYVLASAWSPTLSYTTTNTVPASPVLSSPNGTTVTLPVTLQTDGTYSDTEGHAHYQTEYQIDFTSDFTSADVVTVLPTPETDLYSTTVSTMPRGLDFYWRARYYDAWGDPSAWSAPLSFSIQNNPPTAPVLSTPADGLTDAPKLATLTTNGVYSDPDSDPHGQTQWQISDASDFASLVVDETSSSALHTFTTSSTLAAGTTYYWRVRFYDNLGGVSDWSAQRSFTTGMNNPPDQPVLSTPSDGASSQALSLTLQTDGNYNDIDGDPHSATQWQVCLNADFTMDVVLDSTPSSRLYQMPLPDQLLSTNTTYYWRAKYFDNDSGESLWTDPFSFTTIATDPEDTNGNGLPDSQELLATSLVDLDNEGTPDVSQPDITTINTFDASTEVGIKVRSGVSVEKMASIDPAAITDSVNRPSADQFAFGMVQFKISVPNPGDTAQVAVYFGSPAAATAQWWKWDPVNGWQDYSANAVFSGDRTFVTIDLQDGGIGDADGVANGVIIDPSGLREPPASSSSDSGNKRGCFISSSALSGMEGQHNIFALFFFILGVMIVSAIKNGRDKKACSYK